jgi:peptide/nickel transport system permease protein
MNPSVEVLARDRRALSPARWLLGLGRFARRRPLGAAGAVIILLMIGAAAFAPFIAPYHPLETDFAAQFSPPTTAHWLGTDAFGRDLLSRLIYGSRTALLVGFAAAFLGATAGAILGVASAYFGGRIDLVVQRLVDIFLAFPIIILALAVVSILGTGVSNVIMAITIPMIPNCARVVRSSALAVRAMPYVDAARAAGFGYARIIFRHMLPNVMAPYLIMLTAYVGQAILLEASLSFLGLGINDPSQPTWGQMLSQARRFVNTEFNYALWPGLAISIVVFAFNMLGDALRDLLDPRLRGGQ